MQEDFDLVVIGGGAAGFFCAVNAARLKLGLKVVVLEKTDKLLSKVRVSGGGRCNLSHNWDDIEQMAMHYPRGRHFVRKAFHEFFVPDTVDWFTSRGVAVKTEADGRMFPVSNSSASIIDCLLREANAYGVAIWTHAEVVTVRNEAPADPAHRYAITLKDGRTLAAKALCIAAGGYPKSASFAWIEALGHHIEPPVPSLFTLNAPGHPITALMGVAVHDALIRFRGTKLEARGPVLVTHWGLSGPAVLRLSAWGAQVLHAMDYTGDAIINWAPEYHEAGMQEQLISWKQERSRTIVDQKNPIGLPQRMWSFLLQGAGIQAQQKWGELANRELNKLASLLCGFELPVKGKTTFKEEFVTAGGVKTSEVNPQTMESRLHPGLYFAGEILDVDGITGGYNFQHAWTSAHNAAAAIAAAS